MRLLAIFLLFIFASSCSKKEAPEKRALNIAICTEIRTLDPRVGVEEPSSQIIRMLFDGLMRLDETGTIAPAVAKSYVVSEDGKTYTFTLRKSCWSDGAPLTAHDFEYAWKKAIDPQSLSHGAQDFYFIKNAKLAAEGKVGVNEVGIRAVDDYTFEVVLEHPAPYFLEFISCTLLCPIPKHLDQSDPNWVYRTDGQFVSNGPFKLKQWKQGDYVTVVKNPRYWDQEHVHLPEIKVNFIEESMTQFQMYEKGEIDWFGEPLIRTPPEAIKNLKVKGSYCAIPSPNMVWFFLNNDAFPFNNKKMRKAFSYAINRQEIVDHIFEGNAYPTYGVIAPCYELGNPPCFADGKFYEARKLFDEALLEMGFTRETLPPIVLKYTSGTGTGHQVIQTVQQVWQKVFGIKVNLYQSEWRVHFTAVQKGDYQIGMMGWISLTVDPIFMLENFKYKNDMINMGNWESQEFLDLLEASNHESDPEKRNKILIAAEKVMMDEMALIPICCTDLEYSKNPKLIGVHLRASGDIDFKFANFSQ